MQAIKATYVTIVRQLSAGGLSTPVRFQASVAV
jgi:hypothetical protein